MNRIVNKHRDLLALWNMVQNEKRYLFNLNLLKNFFYYFTIILDNAEESEKVRQDINSKSRFLTNLRGYTQDNLEKHMFGSNVCVLQSALRDGVMGYIENVS